MHRVLVTAENFARSDLERLSKYTQVVESWRMKEDSILKVIPEVDAVVLLAWPSFMTRDNISRMHRLRFIQTLMVGVNHVPFQDIPRRVTVCSNAGAFSVEVAEHAWALLLAAAKRVVETHTAVSRGRRTISSFKEDLKRTFVLEGKTMGIIGLGGIGHQVSKYARAFGMSVLAFNRSPLTAPGVKVLRGRRGLEKLLRSSDAVVLSVPLTRSTERMISQKELKLMKPDSVLVNVARGDLVDQDALYAHLKVNRSFTYATDVWWFKEGKETLETNGPMAALPNFIGTPHASGPTSLAGGRPYTMAVENTIRFLRGKRPRNVVDRSEYRPN